MRIQAKRSFCCFGFILILSTFLATRWESKWKEKGPLLKYLLESGAIDQKMAELLQDDCTPELLHTKKTLRLLALHFLEQKSSNNDRILLDRSYRTNMDDMVNVLLPQINQILVDCVKRRNLILLDTREENGLNSGFTKYLGFLSNHHLSSTRRMLAQAPDEEHTLSPSPSPAPSISPAPDNVLASSPLVLPFSPVHRPGGEHTAFSAFNAQPTDTDTRKRTVIIAVVVTTFATLVIIALLYLCWRGCCRGAEREKDEKPLLSLSSTDYSITSSPVSRPSTVNGEKPKFLSLGSEPNKSEVNGNSYGIMTGVAPDRMDNSLHIPPGRVGDPGLPPLKPPPGRAVPPKPPPDISGNPPPTPPPLLPSSGWPRPPPPGPPPLPQFPSSFKAGLRPPPPPPGSGVIPPRPPPFGLKTPPGPPRPQSTSEFQSEAGAPKAKLKPFFWDKVLDNPDHSMVWHQIKSGSFQFNEEMIESLFGYAPADKNKKWTKKEFTSQDDQPQYIQIIEARKSQNLAIVLKALNVSTEEICDSLEEGNELPPEIIQTFLKMAPTTDEERKLRLYAGELSQLSPADRFLKELLNVPFAYKRLESLLFMCTLQEEVSMLQESFAILEAACSELRKSRLFLKLLEAVLKTGNRMNDGTFRGGAHAFKLDTLLKLSDVKGTDGKTTLLHFVVQEIIRSEGKRAAQLASGSKSDDLPVPEDSDEHLRSLGLQVVSGLGDELVNVKKAAGLDGDSLTGTVVKLGHELVKARDFLNSEMMNIPEENGFHQTLINFVPNAEIDVKWSTDEEKRVMALVKSTGDYFHGNAGKDEGLRLFMIVRNFLIVLDKVCKEVKSAPRKPSRMPKKEDNDAGAAAAATPDAQKTASVDPRQRLFPAVVDRRIDSSSSDDDDESE